MKNNAPPTGIPCRSLLRAPVSWVVLLWALALLGVAVPLRAQTSVIAVSGPTGPVDFGTVLESAVSIDVGPAALGAYTVDLVYDPAVIVIGSIVGGAAPEFSSAPQANPNSFGTGSTRVSAFQGSSLESPTGTVEVMHITFTVVGAGGSRGTLEVVPRIVADTDGHELLAEPTSYPVTVGGIASLPTVGDCGGTGEVTVNELVLMVNVALDQLPLTKCAAGDGNHDGAITVNEIVAGVNNALI